MPDYHRTRSVCNKAQGMAVRRARRSEARRKTLAVRRESAVLAIRSFSQDKGRVPTMTDMRVQYGFESNQMSMVGDAFGWDRGGSLAAYLTGVWRMAGYARPDGRTGCALARTSLQC